MASVTHTCCEPRRAWLRTPPAELRIVSCHLGNGASVAAIEWGRSVETSMGMTPLEGLVMGTRCGDLDPGVALKLLQRGGFDAARLDQLLNAESGLQGLCGTADFAAIERRAADGDEDCRRAIAIYAHRVRKYIGAYAAVMGGLDAIVFTGGVGENSALARHRICRNLELLRRCARRGPQPRCAFDGGAARRSTSQPKSHECASWPFAPTRKASWRARLPGCSPAGRPRKPSWRFRSRSQRRHAHLSSATRRAIVRRRVPVAQAQRSVSAGTVLGGGDRHPDRSERDASSAYG